MILYGILIWLASVTGIVLFFMGAYPADRDQQATPDRSHWERSCCTTAIFASEGTRPRVGARQS